MKSNSCKSVSDQHSTFLGLIAKRNTDLVTALKVPRKMTFLLPLQQGSLSYLVSLKNAALNYGDPNLMRYNNQIDSNLPIRSCLLRTFPSNQIVSSIVIFLFVTPHGDIPIQWISPHIMVIFKLYRVCSNSYAENIFMIPIHIYVFTLMYLSFKFCF